jgi:hypothetical protein
MEFPILLRRGSRYGLQGRLVYMGLRINLTRTYQIHVILQHVRFLLICVEYMEHILQKFAGYIDQYILGSLNIFCLRFQGLLIFCYIPLHCQSYRR